MITKKITFVIAIIAICSNAFAQITFNGNSSYTYTAVGGPAPTCSPGQVYYNGAPNDSQFSTSGNCMTLTDGSTGAVSGMWVGVCDVLDLTNDFVVCFDADFGSNAASGDGIAFVLNGTGSVAPFPGEGGFIGYGNNTNDVVGIEFDSFADGDIGCHHSEINYGGTNGTQLSSPIPLEVCCGSIIGSGSNSICIYWEVSSGTTGTLTAVYNGQVVAEYTGDLGSLVGTNPQWGFTAGGNTTGQVQTVCNVNMNNQPATNGSPSFTCAYLPATDFTATPDPATLCEGNCLNIALSGPAGSSFCWVADDNIHVNDESLTVQTGSTIDDCPTNDDFNPGGPPTYPNDQVITYTIAPSAGGCVGESFQVTVNLLDELNPICACVQPIATATPNPESICSGGTTSIILTSSEPSTTYEWSATDNPNVSGASTTTQSGGAISETLTNTSSIDQVVTYTVTPTAAGCVGNPIIVNVTVKPIPVITNAPLTEELCSLGTTAIVPTADVTGTTFTWTAVGSSGNVTGFSGSGSGNISETLTNSGTAVETVTYTVTPIGPGTPTCPGTPVDFVVTVNPVPTITNAILTEEFCSLGTTAIVPTADVTGTTYTWTAVGSSGNVTGFSGSGSGNISETLTNSGASVETVTYTVTPVGPGTPTCPGTPVDFVVTVNPVPTITNSTLTEEFCRLGTTAIVPTANVTGTTYTWTAVGSSGNVTGYSASGSGNISETLTNSGTAVETVTYTVTPVGPGTPTCPGTPVDFVVTVNPVPTITNATLTEEFCSIGTTSIVPTADVVGTTYTWTAVGSSVNVTGFSGSGSGNISETLTNSGASVETVTYTVTPVGPGTPTCPGTPVDFVVTVNPVPTITNATLTEEFCRLGTTAIVPTADVVGTTFTWTAVGSSGNITGYSGSGSGNISETLTNSGTAVETVTYTVTPIGPGTPTCPGTPVDFVVTVNPVPTITNATLTEEFCSVGTTSIVPTADVVGTTFTWTAVGSSVNVTGFSGSGSGNISETLTNSGTAVETVTYTVTPIGPGTPTCPGTPVDFVVTVNPVPTITNVTLTEEFCSIGTTSIVPTADVVGTTFTWTAVGSSGNVTGYSASGSGNISETLTNSGTAVETVTYTVTPVGPGTPTCPGTPVDFVVTVNPVPTITNAILTEEFCSLGTTAIVPTADVTGTTFTWTAVGSSGNVTGFSGSGSGNISETLTNSGTAVETVTYTVTPIGPGTPTCPGTPVDFVVTVNPTPIITPDANQVCLNSTVVWTGSATAGSPAWSIISGPGSVTFGADASANPVTLTGTTLGNVTIQYENDNGCVITDILAVLPLPSVTSFIPVTTPICFNGTAEWDIVATPNSDIDYTITGGPGGSGQVTTDAFGDATITLNTVTSDVTVTLTQIDNGSCVFTLNLPQQIAVIPAPTMNDPADITVCGGIAYDPNLFVISPLSSGYAESYQWTNNNTSIGLGVSGSGQINSTTAPANATGAPIIGTIQVTPYLGTCAGTPQTFTITINPTPLMDDPADIGPLCVDATIDPAAFLGNANAPVTTTYSWSNNNTTIGLGANGTDADIPSFTATNGGVIAITSTVTVIPTYTNNGIGCLGAPQQFTIIVDPVPAVSDLNLTICETAPGVATGQDLTSNNGNIYAGATSYNWYNNGGVPGSPVADPTNEDISNGEIFEVEIVTANGCTNIATVTYTVTTGITVSSPTIALCEDALGGGTVAIADLAAYNNNMFTGGTTYTWTASGGGAPVLGPTTAPGGVSASNGYAYDVEVIQGTCPAVIGTITFQVDGQVTAGTVGSIGLCSTDAAVNLYDELGTTPTPTTGGIWSGLSALAGGDQGTFDPSTDLQGAYAYDVLSGNSCSDASETVLVTVTPAVYAGDGGLFQLCASATGVENLSSYNGNSLGPITIGGTWTVNLGASITDPGVAFDGLSGTIDPTGLPLGDYVFEYAVTAASTDCPNDMAQITMTIIGNITLTDPMPVLCEDITGGGQVSAHDLTQYNDPSVFVGGTSYIWTGGNIQTIANGQMINVQVTSGTCVNDIDVTFTVESLPLASATGAGLTCENVAYTLPGAAASSSNGTVSWTVISGLGNITPGTETTLTPEYTPVPADAGSTVTLEMTVTSNNSCGGTATAQYDIVIDPLPQAVTTPLGAVAVCENAGSYTLQPLEASSANGTIQWTHDGSGSLLGSTTLEPTYNAGVGDAGNIVTLTLTITSNNNCVGETATATYQITVEAQPTASTFNSGVTCSSATYTLPAGDAMSTNGTITWTVQSGNGTITAGASTLTPDYTPLITDEGTTVTLLMTVSNGGACLDASATYDIVVDAPPTAIAGGSTAICEGASYTLTSLEATATGSAIQWTHDGTGDITLATSNTEEPEYVSAVGDAGNAVTLTMTVDAGNSCPAATANYTINVDVQPTATAGGSTSICDGTSYTLQGGEATSANGTITWTVQSGNGAITAGANTLTPEYATNPLDVGTTVTLLMTVTNSGSCPDASATYTIDITPLPTLIITDPNPSCAPATVDITFVSVTAGSDAGTLTYWTDNPPTNQLTTVQAQSSGAGMYYIQLEDALGCASIAPVVATANPEPTFTFDTLTPSACNLTDGNITLSGLNVSVDYNVDVFDGTTITSATFTTDAAGDLVIPNLGAGTYEVNVILVSTGCGSTVSIIDIDNPGAPILNAINDTTVCNLFNLEVISGTGLTGNESYWDGSGATGTQYNVGDPIIGTMTMYAYDVNGICSDEVSFEITVNNTPLLDQPNDTIVCDTYGLEVITGLSLTGNETYYDNWPSLGGTVITGSITTSQTVYVHDAVGSCADSTSFVVTVNVTPTLTVTDPAAVCEPNLVDASGSTTTDLGVITYYSDAGLTAVVDETQLNTGIYYVEAVNNGCALSDMVNVTVNPLPIAPTAGVDSEYCSTVEFNVMTASGDGGTLTWYSDAGLTSVITSGNNLMPTNSVGTTTYYVAETLNGCEGPSSQVNITVNFCTVTLPTAFTPDGDGVNDDWEILDIDQTYPENMVYVYNRWGNLLFTSVQGDYDNNRWDGTYKGKDLPVGSYYFIIEYNNEENEKANGIISIVK